MDGCTTAFTTAYLPANGTFNRTTYIYSFKLNSCQQAQGGASGEPGRA